MLIFVDQITERLIYTFDFIFTDRGIKYELTNDWRHFSQNDGNHWIYSEKYSENNVQIIPSTLLFDEDIFVYSIDKALFFEEECLTFNRVCDPFASLFYVLSRYEEYGAKLKDIHDRFPANQSILHRFNWLQKVVCDRWATDILNFLSDKLNIPFQTNPFQTNLVPSFDIDHTYAFKWKDGWRKWLSFSRDYIKKDHLRLEARKSFKSKKIQDPYDSFDEIKSLTERGFKTRIFWLLGEYARYDKNISAHDFRHQILIKDMSNFAEIGLHPSYKSNQAFVYLQNEKKILQQILGTEIKSCRQHFLKIEFPTTYRNLIEAGFTDDYSLGYADEIGFRAGTARSFYFFDLLVNRCTKFRIHPFSYMDGTFHDYKKTDPDVAKISIRNLFQEVSTYGGDFIFIWHNHNITDFGDWKGWKSVYEFTLNLS